MKEENRIQLDGASHSTSYSVAFYELREDYIETIRTPTGAFFISAVDICNNARGEVSLSNTSKNEL
jgi:hypothetical protein